MAIIFNLNNTGTGTLSPPVLDGIKEINAPIGQFLILNGEFTQIFGNNGISINSVNNIDINSLSVTLQNPNGSLQTSINNSIQNYSDYYNLNVNNDINIMSTNLYLNSKTIFNNLPTAVILTIPAKIGMQVFCVDIQQMVFYQVSPISGINLGWYNSSGTIQL